MKSAKYILGFITGLLFLIAICLKVSSKAAQGTDLTENGWVHQIMDGNVVMFFALVMAIAFYYVVKYKNY